MTPEQNRARNEAFQLVMIAERILDDAGLGAYAEELRLVAGGMKADAKMLRKQEMDRRLG